MDSEKITKKIQKLLALSSNNPSEEEAKSALLKAQELMLQYNIEISGLGKEDADKVVIKAYTFNNKRILGYHISLAGAVAKNFRCKMFYSRSRLSFIGFEEDAETCVILIEYLVNFVDSGFKSFLKKDKKENPFKYYGEGASFSKNLKRDWAYGFNIGLLRAFEERAAEDARYNLMVITPNAVVEKYEDESKHMAKGQYNAGPGLTRDRDAVMDGLEKGKNSLKSRELEDQRKRL